MDDLKCPAFTYMDAMMLLATCDSIDEAAKKFPLGNSFDKMLRDSAYQMLSKHRELKKENTELEAKLNHNRCNSGHETLPLALWECPRCVEIKIEHMERVNRALEAKMDAIFKLEKTNILKGATVWWTDILEIMEG